MNSRVHVFGAFVLAELTSVPITLCTPVSISQLGTPYVQDFNTLASSGVSSSLPSGWVFVESGANANDLYTAGTGSSNTGDTYSFGSSSNSDRALGGLRSNNLVPLLGVAFRNDTGKTINALAISYFGEQWRLGASGRQDRLDFQYSLNATSLNSGAWMDVDALDFGTPDSSGVVGARDGNATAYRTLISGTIGGLSVYPNTTFWLRWVDYDASGADDGLAVDDFSLTAWGATPSNPVSDTGKTFPLGLLGLAFLGVWFRSQGCAYAG
jgi:hypothetical protein